MNQHTDRGAQFNLKEPPRPMLTDKQGRAIRSRFWIFQRKIYLTNCSQGAPSDTEQTGLEGIPEALEKNVKLLVPGLQCGGNHG